MYWAFLGSALGVLLMSSTLSLEPAAGLERINWTWCAIALMINVVCAGAVFRFRKRATGDEHDLARTKPLLLCTAAVGAVWGIPAWIMQPNPVGSVSTALIIGCSLVLMGGAGALAAYRPLVHAFAFPLAGLLISGLLHAELVPAPPISTFLLALMALIFARTQERALRTAILLRFEKDRLIASATAQRIAAEQARAKADEATHEAELANHSKTIFLAAAGHDLRQPMHALIQYFGHLQRKNKDPELDQTVVRIGKSLDAMHDLLDSILEVSKLMMGSVKPSLASFPIARLIDRIDVQMRPLAENKGLSFRAEGSAAWVRTDEVLLERVLRNLTLNAIRYTDSGGVCLRVRQRGAAIAIQVFDSGIGIQASERQRIFEAFYQVGNVARNKSKGLGLGLAIVKQLSDLLGLRLSVRSRFGRGSLFSVELDSCLATAPAIAITPQRDKVDYARGAIALVIDDNEDSLAATAESLASFGCKVLAASSGLQALERLQGQEFIPDLIVCDYRLEGETGIDAIQMILDNQKALLGDEVEIAALIISGDTAPHELEMVTRAGYRMLHKPVRLDDLYAAVNSELTQLAMPNS